MMKFKMLETVVLQSDLAEYGLKAGDLGTIVEIYRDEDLEVEFLLADGNTKAVVTLNNEDIRHVKSSDMLAVRSLQKTS